MQTGASEFLDGFVLLPRLHTLVGERAAPQTVHPICCSVVGERRFRAPFPENISLRFLCVSVDPAKVGGSCGWCHTRGRWAAGATDRRFCEKQKVQKVRTHTCLRTNHFKAAN